MKLYHQTVELNPYLNRGIERVWEGANPRQFLFLTWPAREVLYGGAAGGGKSVSLLAASLQFVNVPGYSALLLRKTFQDLNKPDALIPLSLALLGGTDAKWNEQLHRWKFPSGATLSFGYLASKNDHLQYQGAAFQFIGFDEATQFPENQYLYLHSRLRKATGLNVPLRMRAASNPGGPGHDWVKKRFVDPKTRGERVFISARMEDNPKLDRESYERSLRELDPVTRKRLRDGNWDITASHLFKREWFRYWKFDAGESNYLCQRADGTYRPVKVAECWRLATMDVAGTEKEDLNDPDYSVFQVWAVTPEHHLILLFQWRARAEIPEVALTAIRLARQWGVEFVGVEKNGVALGVVQTMARKNIAVKGLQALVNKVARSQTALIRMEQGSIFFPENESWVREELEPELLTFPDTPHDDQCDALVWGATLAQKIGGPLKDEADKAHAASRRDAEDDPALQATPDRGPIDPWVGYDDDD